MNRRREIVLAYVRESGIVYPRDGNAHPYFPNYKGRF
jgi:hypothetical protein